MVGRSEFVWQVDSGETMTGGVVKEEIVGGFCPDGCEFDAAGAVQDELDAAAASSLLQFEFCHGKMELQQIFTAAECEVTELPKLFPVADVGGRFRRCSGCR